MDYKSLTTTAIFTRILGLKQLIIIGSNLEYNAPIFVGVQTLNPYSIWL